MLALIKVVLLVVFLSTRVEWHSLDVSILQVPTLTPTSGPTLQPVPLPTAVRVPLLYCCLDADVS
jgi:hypothetical protein